MKKVELHQAWVWTCDDCGRDNFEYSVRLETPDANTINFATEEDRRLFESVVDSGDVFQSAPNKVECKFCRKVYKVKEV